MVFICAQSFFKAEIMEWFSDIKNSKIDLSIIIPMYNVEDYIIETLNSMRGVRVSKLS